MTRISYKQKNGQFSSIEISPETLNRFNETKLKLQSMNWCGNLLLAIIESVDELSEKNIIHYLNFLDILGLEDIAFPDLSVRTEVVLDSKTREWALKQLERLRKITDKTTRRKK